MKTVWLIVLIPLISVVAISIAVHQHAKAAAQHQPTAVSK
jgi:hypothetical protein